MKSAKSLRERVVSALSARTRSINSARADLSHLELRYVTLRRCNGEIRQNYYFFADLKDEVDVNFHSSEGISRWFDLSELNSLEMPFTSKYVVKHYLEIGCKNHDIYAGIADGEKIVFVNNLHLKIFMLYFR